MNLQSTKTEMSKCFRIYLLNQTTERKVQAKEWKNKYCAWENFDFLWEIITNRKWFKHTEEVSLAMYIIPITTTTVTKEYA